MSKYIKEAQPLNREQYLDTQSKLLRIAREVRDLDLEKFVDAIRTAETIAPIIDPTAFKHGSKNLTIIKILAEAALIFQSAYPDPQAVIDGALDAQGYCGEVPPYESRRSGARAFPKDRGADK